MIHELSPQPGAPLNGVPDTVDFAAQRTVGLLNTDGIIAEVPGSLPKIILYLQKILNGDKTVPLRNDDVSPGAMALKILIANVYG